MCFFFLILVYVLPAPTIISFSSTFRRARIAEFKHTSFVGANFLLFSVTFLLWFQIFLSVFYLQPQNLSSLRLKDAGVLPRRTTKERETSKAKRSSSFGNWTADINGQTFTGTQKVIKMLCKVISKICLRHSCT